MNRMYQATNKRNGALVRMYYVNNTRINHYEVWCNNRTFVTESEAEAFRIYNDLLA